MTNKTTRILLVEDNPADYRLLREHLAEVGIGAFEVDHAACLKEALERASDESRYDVVLLDLSLPDSQGMTTVHRCRAAMPLLPIVVLTGMDDENLGIQAIRSGAQDYLIKSQVDSRLLMRTIGYAQERHRLEVVRANLTEQLREARDELERRVHERTADLRCTVETLRGEVNARQQAEDSLRESEERFRTVFERAPLGVAMVSLEGQFLKTNRALQEMLGYSEAEMTKRTLADLTSVEDVSREGDPFEELTRGLRGTYKLETRSCRGDGQWIWIQMSVSLIRDHAGQPSYAVALAADVTERRRTEKQMADLMVAEYRRLGQELHDGLIQQIIGLGMMARSLHQKLKAASSPQADAAAELCTLIREAQNQSRAMLRGLRPVEVDANGLMAAIEELVSGTAKWYGVRCTFKCDRPVPVEDNTVATQLFYIAREAVTNAVRHAMAKHIEVSLGSKGKDVTMNVSDDGVGIQQDRKAEGMGLRIMRYRAGLIGATLDIGPACGRGTLVTCTLKQENHDADEQDDAE